MTVATKTTKKSTGRPCVSGEVMVTKNFQLTLGDIALLGDMAIEANESRSEVLRRAIRAYAASQIKS